MENYEREQIKRLKEILGKHSSYVKERMRANLELNKSYRIDDDIDLDYKNYMKGLGLSNQEVLDRIDAQSTSLVSEYSNYNSSAPQGAFCFNNVPLGKSFDAVMKVTKKYKMAISVENINGNEVSGFAIT